MSGETDPRGVDAALRAIVEGVEAETGTGFFRALARSLRSALDVRHAFVSELVRERSAFRTLAVCGPEGDLPDFETPLRGTPCEAVLSGETCHYVDRLRERFPEDVGLEAWCAESYAGVPLLDARGEVVGHLAIFDSRPRPDAQRTLAILRIFAVRARVEIERLRVEGELRASEERWRDLFEEAPYPIVVHGLDGRNLRWNRKFRELMERDDETLGRMRVTDLVAEGESGRGTVRRYTARLLAGETLEEEIELALPDGRRKWVLSSARPFRDRGGAIVGFQAVPVDVTERKRMEALVRESEERLAQILASAMDAIVTIDERGTVELFNQAAEKIFGCAATEAIGRPFARFLSEGFRLELSRALDEDDPAAGGYLGNGAELRARRAGGREFPVEATLSAVEVGGRRLHTLILRDVEERQRAEDERRRLARQKEYLEEEIRSVYRFEEIVGRSPAVQGVLEQVALVAPTDSSVLILGETGTGKELIARAIHSSGPRRERPLIKVNCAALPAGLVESELFGHERGAFTGATERRIGRFELANGGTLFLDEIGELPLDAQAKLLRVLQEHELERIGGRATVRIDVRIIAATNRDLEQAVVRGTFRQDLYYRLNVFPIRIPPLRERADDVALLAHYFVARYAAKIGRRITSVPEDAILRLRAYPWPGNVRELENVIERAVILSRGPDLRLPPQMLAAATEPATRAEVRAEAAESSLALEDVERRHILAVLERTGWRIEGGRGAAQALDMSPSTLRYRMGRLGIRRPA